MSAVAVTRSNQSTSHMQIGVALGDRGAAWRILTGIAFATALAGFIAALEVTYAAFMAPRFGYLGYVYNEPDRIWMLASFLVLLVVAMLLPQRLDRVSGFAVWFLYAAILVPVVMVPLFGSTRPPGDTFLFGLYCSVIWALIALAVRWAPTQVVPIRTQGARILWIVVASLSVVTYVYIHQIFGLSFNVMSVFDIRDTRLEYRDQIIPTVPLLGYLITNQGNVINPFLMAVGAARGRWEMVLLGVAGQIVLYSTTGYKTVLISIPICILLAVIFKYRKSFAGITVVFAATMLVWVSIIIDRIASIGLVDILVSRVFLTAGYLMPLYRDVYDESPWALWAYSFLAPLVESPYDTSPGFQVARETIGRPDIQLNGSLFADGYANLGLAGIAVEATALVAILLIVDSASRGLPLALTVPVAVIPIFSLANGSPFTGLLSFGFALMILLFALSPREPGLVPTSRPGFTPGPDRHNRRGPRQQLRLL